MPGRVDEKYEGGWLARFENKWRRGAPKFVLALAALLFILFLWSVVTENLHPAAQDPLSYMMKQVFLNPG